MTYGGGKHALSVDISLHLHERNGAQDAVNETSTPGASTSQGYEKYRVYRDLVNILEAPHHESTPDKTWHAYRDLLRLGAWENISIPLEMHQSVLRRSLPSTYSLRAQSRPRDTARQRLSPTLSTVHPYQDRILMVLANIRQSGFSPTLRDFHLILNQYAAVGHVQGCLDVLQDITNHGYSPTEQTFGYVFVSLARRVALGSMMRIDREKFDELVSQTCNMLMDDMQARSINFTPKILDLCTRIMGTSRSLKTYQSLLSSLYGIDLDQPDVITSSFAASFQNLASIARDSGLPPPAPPNISTATLNTIIQLVGSGPSASLPKMISAFETLTNPLPSLHTPEHAYGYADADDDEPHYTPDMLSEKIPPRKAAQPNTQTYTYLIQYSANLGSKVFARYFLRRAIHAEREHAECLQTNIAALLRDLREDDIEITDTIIDQIRALPRPTVTVNLSMFRIIYRMADNRSDVGLMAWLQYHEHSALRMKQRYAEVMRALSDAIEARHREPESSKDSSSTAETPDNTEEMAENKDTSEQNSPRSIVWRAW